MLVNLVLLLLVLILQVTPNPSLQWKIHLVLYHVIVHQRYSLPILLLVLVQVLTNDTNAVESNRKHSTRSQHHAIRKQSLQVILRHYILLFFYLRIKIFITSESDTSHSHYSEVVGLIQFHQIWTMLATIILQPIYQLIAIIIGNPMPRACQQMQKI